MLLRATIAILVLALPACSAKRPDVGLAVPITCPAPATPPAVLQKEPMKPELQARWNVLLQELRSYLEKGTAGSR